jgi:hypothetical protein
MLGEVQHYHNKTHTYTEEEWREKERQRRSKRETEEEGELESGKHFGGGKREMVCRKNGRKWKQCETYARLKTGGEMEVSECELSVVAGVVKSSEPEACTDGQDKDESVTVGGIFLEEVDPCLLSDPFVVSVCEKGVWYCGIGEGNPKWSCDNCLRFCWSEGAEASRQTNWDNRCDLNCSQE